MKEISLCVFFALIVFGLIVVLDHYGYLHSEGCPGPSENENIITGVKWETITDINAINGGTVVLPCTPDECKLSKYQIFATKNGEPMVTNVVVKLGNSKFIRDVPDALPLFWAKLVQNNRGSVESIEFHVHQHESIGVIGGTPTMDKDLHTL